MLGGAPPGSAPGGVVYSISPMQLVGALLMGVYPTADIWSSFYNLVLPWIIEKKNILAFLNLLFTIIIKVYFIDAFKISSNMIC
jgi:hypothetical protein